MMTQALPTDGYVPALPQIQKFFQVDAKQLEETLSIFVFTTGIGQLLFGPLSDRFGRRSIAFISLGFFIAGSLLHIYADKFSSFILGRFSKGIGAGGMAVVAAAIVRDLYSGNKASKIYGYLAGVAALATVSSPILGGLLAAHLGWRSIGYMYLTSAAIALICIYLLIEETLLPSKKILLSLEIIIIYKNLLFNKAFLFYSLVGAIGLSYAFIFSSTSSPIIINLLHLSSQRYGMCYAGYGTLYMFGNFLAGYIVEKIGVDRVAIFGLSIALLGTTLLLIWNYYGGLSLASFLLPMLIITTGSTFCQTAGIGGAMNAFAANAGSAAAMHNAFRYMFIALIGLLVVSQQLHSVFPAGISIFILSIAGLALYTMIFINRKIKTG